MPIGGFGASVELNLLDSKQQLETKINHTNAAGLESFPFLFRVLYELKMTKKKKEASSVICSFFWSSAQLLLRLQLLAFVICHLLTCENIWIDPTEFVDVVVVDVGLF